MKSITQNNLPVAPEFVQTLQIQAADTLRECLIKLNAPQDVIDLVNDIDSLGYYQTECYRDPSNLTGDDPNFDAVNVVIDTINHLAAVGAKFHDGLSISKPRKGTLLAEREKVKAK